MHLHSQTQTIKTAIESAQMLLRIDDIVSGISRKQMGGRPQQPADEGDGGGGPQEQ